MKKALASILAFAILTASALIPVSSAYGEHEHKFMKMANMNCHYEECEICFELQNVDEHSFQNGKCTVCGHPQLINPFTDVSPDAWYHNAIVQAVATGIINGKTTTEFCPDDLLTYAEAVKLAACMNQVYMDGEVTLTGGNPWYQPYADYCLENGITEKEYNYNENVTRAGYMEIFANALPDEAFKEINDIPDGCILDVKDNAPYAIYVYKLYRAGIVTGVDLEHNCNPDATIKRSEVAAIISRMMDEDERVRFDMDPPENQIIIDNNGTVEGDYGNPTEIIYLMPTIIQQPKGYEAEHYGEYTELYVEVKGGTAPYTYEWFYYGYRNQKTIIDNGDYVKDASSEALILAIEKENTLLGSGIFCTITDADGNSVTTDTVKVYGPFSMPVDDVTIITASKEYLLAGRVADGVVRPGDKISIERNGKIIAIGTAKELQMFGKQLDEAAKGDYIGMVFELTKGVRPQAGDIAIRFKDAHVIDTSDIVN